MEDNNLDNTDKNEQKPINKINTGKSRLNSRAGSVAVFVLISVVAITVAAISVGRLIPLNSKYKQTETLLRQDREIDGVSPFVDNELPARAYEAPKTAEMLPDETMKATVMTEEESTAASTTTESTTVPTTATSTTTKPKPTPTPTSTPTTPTAPTTTAEPAPTTTTSPAPTTTAAPVWQVHDQDTQALLAVVNNHRQSIGAAPLSVAGGSAAEAAAIRAQEISIKFDHVRPDGSGPFELLNQMGVSYRAAGENLAMASSSYSADQVLQLWLNSEGHKKNIESTMFTSMAIGIYETNGNKYWVQLFLG